MSAKGVRKCKACNQAVKGHLGPYGLGKCTVGQEDKNENFEEKIEEEVEKHRVNGEAKLKLSQEDVEVLGDMNNVAVPDSSNNNLSKLPFSSKETSDVSSLSNGELNRSVGGKNNLINNEEYDKTEDVNNSMNESEILEKSHFLEETEKDEFEEESITTETKENKSDDESYVEPSLFLGDSSGGPKEDDRKRLMSFSDCDIDIRKLLMGRSFVLCRCDNTDCDCDGEVEFSEDSLEGEVTDLYFDPTDTDIDFKPTLKLEKKGWNKAVPNIVRLKMGGITAPGVIASNGELVLTASRVVEMVKGRRELSTDLRGSLSLQLKVSSLYTKRGVRSPILYKDIECFLYMLDKLMGEVEDRSRISAEIETEIERAEGYGTVSNSK